MKFHHTCGFAAAALCLMSQAHAATVFLNNPSLAGGGVASTVTLGPPAFIPTGPVGAITGTLTGAPGYAFLGSTNPLLAGVSFTFCVELTQQGNIGVADPDYNIVNPSVSYPNWGANAAAINLQVDKLMALALPSVNAAPTATSLYDRLGALQLSLWELIYDYSASFSYNLGAGVFQVTSSASVTSQANAWLSASALSAAVPTAHYVVAHDPSHQDLLAVVAVPEPASVALMLLGLAAVGGAAQRRRAQA
jgi:hypothetical protein